MIQAIVMQPALSAPPRQFEMLGNDVTYEECHYPQLGFSQHILGSGFRKTQISSSGEGLLNVLYENFPASSISAASHKAIEDSFTSPVLAQKRAASVNKANANENVFELRRLTGLTWECLSNMLNVDRRTLHNWIKGRPIRESNGDHIAKTLSVVLFADRGSAKENAKALNERSEDGLTPFDAIKAKLYDNARQYLSYGQPRPQMAQSVQDCKSSGGEFRPMAMHVEADGAETIEPLPNEPKPASRKRRIRRG